MTCKEYESKSQMKRVEILKAEEKQMTHEELLEKFTDYEAHFDQVRDEERLYRILRAVVELHKPEGRNVQPLTRCWKCQVTYPCAEIQAIEKELS